MQNSSSLETVTSGNEEVVTSYKSLTPSGSFSLLCLLRCNVR
jgi:hypothetical protein